MISWYFVCTGNICRSAFAQAYLAHELITLTGQQPQVTSGGTGINQALEPTDEIKEMGYRYGLEFAQHRPSSVSLEVLEQQDIILTATRAHRAQIFALAPHLINRTFTIKEFALLLEKLDVSQMQGDSENVWWENILTALEPLRRRLRDSSKLDIADPFHRSFRVYEKACQEIVASLHTVILTEFAYYQSCQGVADAPKSTARHLKIA